MDRAAVVAYRIDDGRTLLNRLMHDGLEVSAAFWMYTNDDERWGLYIATESVNSIGIKNSYLIVVLALKSMPELRIELFEVTLIEPTRPLAAAIIDYIGMTVERSDPWIEKESIDGAYVELAYVYPLPTNGESTALMQGDRRIRTAR